MQEWKGFNEGIWQQEINVRDFIQKNYLPSEGDASFLEVQLSEQKVFGWNAQNFWLKK